MKQHRDHVFCIQPYQNRSRRKDILITNAMLEFFPDIYIFIIHIGGLVVAPAPGNQVLVFICLPPSLTVQLSNHSLTGWGNTPTTTHIVHTQWLGYTQSHIQGKNNFFDKFNICKHIYSPYSVKTICDQKGNALTNWGQAFLNYTMHVKHFRKPLRVESLST